MLINSVYKNDESYYPSAFLKECKCIVRDIEKKD